MLLRGSYGGGTHEAVVREVSYMAGRSIVPVVYDQLNAIWVLGVLARSLGVCIAALGRICHIDRILALKMQLVVSFPWFTVRDHSLCVLARLLHDSRHA